MKPSRLFVLTTSIAFFAACDRSPSEGQRLAEERAALERERAQLATERATADRAATEQERAKLESERAALEAERARLAGNKEAQAKAQTDARLAAEREQRIAAERRAADAEAQRIAAEKREREARESARNAAQTAAAQARAEQSVDFFYDALDPYGDWVQVEGRGYCWRPQVGRGWQPYTDGGWVSTDYGWTWRSNEPFGWAVYHYGRWTRAPRLGWIWVPGTEWGPAWVSWRRSNEYVGWAPLPPDAYSASGFTASVDSYFDIGPGLYTFLRIADFGEPTYVGRVVAPEQNVTIIRQTTNVTNVTYQTVQNRVSIVNRGPELTVINQRSRRPVEHLAVERVAAGASTTAKPGLLQLIAPFLNAKPPVAKPKQVKEQVKASELEHGWAEAKGDAPKIREHAAKEARQAEDAQRKSVVAKAPVAPLTPTTTPKPPLPPPTRPVGGPRTEPTVSKPIPPKVHPKEEPPIVQPTKDATSKIRERAPKEARQGEDAHGKAVIPVPPTAAPTPPEITPPFPPPTRPATPQPEQPATTPVPPTKHPEDAPPVVQPAHSITPPDGERPTPTATPPPPVAQATPPNTARPAARNPSESKRPMVQRSIVPAEAHPLKPVPNVSKPVPAKPQAPLKQLQLATPDPANPDPEPRKKKRKGE